MQDRQHRIAASNSKLSSFFSLMQKMVSIYNYVNKNNFYKNKKKL